MEFSGCMPAASPWRVNPDNIQVTEVDAFFIIPAVAGAAFGPDTVLI